MFSENSHDPYGPLRHPAAQGTQPCRVKGRLKQLTELESYLTWPRRNLRGRDWLPLRVPSHLSLQPLTFLHSTHTYMEGHRHCGWGYSKCGDGGCVVTKIQGKRRTVISLSLWGLKVIAICHCRGSNIITHMMCHTTSKYTVTHKKYNSQVQFYPEYNYLDLFG